MKMHSHVAIGSLVLLLSACAGSGPAGDKAKDEGDETTQETDESLGGEAPADSTGATGQVSVGFGSSTAALWLDEAAAPAELAVNETISLSVARFNIAAIKVKATKDPSVKEVEHEKEVVAEETEAVKEVDAVGESSEAALADKGKTPEDKGSKKEEMQERRGKIAAKKGDLAAKEKDRLDKEAGKDKGTRFKGPYIYDAITGELSGDLPPVDLVDGSYRRVEFQLKRSLDVADDDPLLGNVFYIKGTVTKADETKVPFEIEWHVAMNFRLKAENPFSVVSGGENKLDIAFDMGKWFEGIDLTAAEVDADGTVYVNKQSNREILKQLHKNMKVHTRFGKDADGDGKLGAAEQAGQGEETTDATVE